MSSNCNTAADFRHFESRYGELPADLKNLYSFCASFVLFKKVEILPLHDLITANQAVLGDEREKRFSKRCIAFCKFDNGEYVGYEMNSGGEGELLITDLDPFGEDEPIVISNCLKNFLTNLLVSEGDLYWLDLGYRIHS